MTRTTQHFLAAASLLCMAAPVAADEFTQHGAHEHGRALLQVALQDNTLQVELVVPALHVLGFEHEPRTQAERQTAATAPARLRDLATPVRLPDAAGCQRQSARLVEEEKPSGGHDAHHGHQHGHAHDHGAGEHHDIHVTWTYRCAQPGALTWLEPALLSSLRDVSRLQVDSLLPGAQKSSRVSRANERVALR